MGRRLGVVVVGAAAWIVTGAAPAQADPPGPTDFQTEIIRIHPPTSAFDVGVVGGDSFLVLHSDGSATIEVVGYRGEPYLRFLTDGTVERNERSPTTSLNEDRYAAVEIPDDASPDAVPLWRVVAGGGSYAWHDHRAHWMNRADPPGRGPGDAILEGVIPLLVDGDEVDITVRSVWQAAPSPIPMILGGTLGIAIVAAVAMRMRRATLAAAVALVSATALAVGVVAYVSVPAETAPSWTLWGPPVMSLVLAGLAAFPKATGRLQTATERAAPTLTLLAAAELAVWAVLRWDWLWHAILPTGAPFWLDRAVTAMVLAASLGLGAASVSLRLARR